eukprot:CAMPEP_0172700706 /NCGR_PEP_ID=MMETSP1074-20121228/31099_1 /TAXON_ID=2916 /ORGANISM="Ceratium fusus, Strain PA161109" /LENGTH=1116 /DNA_ID=CAMNT_0013522133 /DNA_START=152 /DNA_END=3500 /DNA_ORIENTATION=+
MSRHLPNRTVTVTNPASVCTLNTRGVHTQCGASLAKHHDGESHDKLGAGYPVRLSDARTSSARRMGAQAALASGQQCRRAFSPTSASYVPTVSASGQHLTASSGSTTLSYVPAPAHGSAGLHKTTETRGKLSVNRGGALHATGSPCQHAHRQISIGASRNLSPGRSGRPISCSRPHDTGRALSREEMIRTGKLLRGGQESCVTVPAQTPSVPALVRAASVVCSQPQQQQQHPLCGSRTEGVAAASALSSSRTEDVALTSLLSAPRTEGFATGAVLSGVPTEGPDFKVRVIQADTVDLGSVERQTASFGRFEQTSLRRTLTPRDGGGCEGSLLGQSVRSCPAQNDILFTRTDAHDLGASVADVRLQREVESLRCEFAGEAAEATQLRLQLRTFEAAAQAAALQADAASAEASASIQALRSASVQQDAEENKATNSHLKVELACIKNMRDSLHSDLQDEANVAEELRRQLVASETTVREACHSELSRLRSRNAELDEQVALSKEASDRMHVELEQEAAEAVVIREELSVSQVMAGPGIPDHDDIDTGMLQIRLVELEVDNSQQQSRIIELNAELSDVRAIRSQIQRELEEERVQSTTLRQQLEELRAGQLTQRRVLSEEAQPLRLTIVGAKGLRNADWLPGTGKSDPYCVCEVEGRPEIPKVQTGVINDDLDPIWDFDAEIHGFNPGDSLAFHVYDKDWGKKDDFLGTLTLRSEVFYPDGYEGECILQDAGAGIDARLMLRIPAVTLQPSVIPADRAGGHLESARRDNLERALEAEQAKVVRLSEALAAVEERAQMDEMSQKVSQVPSECQQTPTVLECARATSELFNAARENDISAFSDALREEDTLETLLRSRDDEGRTVLQVALVSGSAEIAKLLCNEGQRWAQRRKYMFDLQGQLLERELGRFINGKDDYGKGALSSFCASPHATREAVILLLESQADPMQRDMTGATPFIECAKVGNVGLLKLLLGATQGAVLLNSDESNRSALHWASHSGHVEAVELLLKAGADADAADVEGRSAADAARQAGYIKVAEMLAEAMSDEALSAFIAGAGTGGPGEPDTERVDKEKVTRGDFDLPKEDSDIPQEDNVLVDNSVSPRCQGIQQWAAAGPMIGAGT